MFLRMQNFDFCPNLIKFYQIYPNLTQFIQIYPNFAQIGVNFAQICLKKMLGDAPAFPVSTPLLGFENVFITPHHNVLLLCLF